MAAATQPGTWRAQQPARICCPLTSTQVLLSSLHFLQAPSSGWSGSYSASKGWSGLSTHVAADARPATAAKGQIRRPRVRLSK